MPGSFSWMPYVPQGVKGLDDDECACESESIWISVMLTQSHLMKTQCTCVYCVSCHDAVQMDNILFTKSA